MNGNAQITTENKQFNIKKYLTQIQVTISKSMCVYLAFCFIVPFALMFLVYLAWGIHPFDDGSVLILDLNGQYVYFFEALRNTFYGNGSMLYSFFRNLGGEFMGMYAYYLASPLSYIVVLFPQKHILDALFTIILLKTGLSGLTFGYYLHKNSKHRNPIIIVMFSVMYALCAYSIVYQHNIMWMDAMIWLPLVTLGIEQLIKRGKYKMFVISLSLLIMSHYYIGYMTCIYVAIYFFYYLFAHSPEKINLRNEKHHKLMSFVRIVLFSGISVAISAFMILCAYYSLTFGKNDFSNPNWSLIANFNLLDFLTKFLPGSYDTVRPQGLPLVYCGILTVILLPIYFLTKKISSREKIASLMLICVFIFSFVTNPLDLIWHGFQSPNWLNYRYSFMLCFILLILAYKGFGNLRSVGEKVVLATSAFIILFVAICEKMNFETYVESQGKLLVWQTIWLTVFAVIALLVVLCLIIRHKNIAVKSGLSAILAFVVCIEIFCSAYFCTVQFNGDVTGYRGIYVGYRAYTEFIGDLRPITNKIKEKDTGFYRMEKLEYRKPNDNMALGIRGLSSSTSTLNADVVAFLNKMGYASRSHKSIYLGGNPVSDSLLGIKYLIDKTDDDQSYPKQIEMLNNSYEQVETKGKYAAYYNPNALSIAYGVDSSVNDFDLSNQRFGTYFERLNGLVDSMVPGEQADIFVPVKKSYVNRDVSPSCTYTESASFVTYSKMNDFGSATVTYSFVAPYTGEYYFYTPARVATEATLSVDYIPVKKDIPADEENQTSENDQMYDSFDEYDSYNKTKKKAMVERKYLGADTNCIASLGYFEYGDTVYVNITLGNGDLSLYTYYNNIWYIDQEAFDNAFTSLKNGPQFNVTEYTEDNLKGNITTQTDAQTILTTIPYDEGWKVYVDGKEVSTYKTLDALMAFDISTAGVHRLEMKYSPDIYKTGAFISIIGIVAFISICVIDVIIKRKDIKKKGKANYDTDVDKWCLEDFEDGHKQLEIYKDKLTKLSSRIFKTSKKPSATEENNKKTSNEADEENSQEGDN